MRTSRRAGGGDLVSQLVVASFVLAAAAVGCGPPSSSNVRDPGGSGGKSGTDAGGGDASGDRPSSSGGDASSCSTTPSGCFCLPGSNVGQLASCAPDTVATGSDERGTCCNGDSACHCDAFVCKRAATGGYCECGTAYMVGVDVASGTTAADCPAPTGNQQCCLETTMSPPSCVCGTLTCEGTATTSNGCSAAMIAICVGGEQTVSACQ